MKRQFIFSYFFLVTLLTTTVNAQKIVGSWLLNHIREDGITKEQVELLTFKESGELLVRDTPFGTWKINSKSKTLILDAETISGTYTISSLTHHQLRLIIGNNELFFIKIDKNKVEQDNINSGLVGVWQITNTNLDEINELIRFSAPNEFTYIEEDAYSSSKVSGTWLYNKKEKQLILISQPNPLRGINRIISKNKTNIKLQNKSSSLLLTKKKPVSNIERLNFSEDDFYNQEGEYLYENDANKLPWKSEYDIFNEASKIDTLVYQFSKLNQTLKIFNTSYLQAIVKTDVENQSFSIDNVFNQYDRFTIPEGLTFQENKYDLFKPLYPCQADTFRVTGKETITIPAGTFVCTVVEAINNEERIKLYLIDQKPGILAKIIKDNPEEMGYYTIYILNKIIYKINN